MEREGDRVALVRVLGPIDVVDDAGDAHAPTSPLRRSLLAVLALEACRVVRSDRLLEVVWNGAPPASMTTALRFHISALRREVPIAGLIEGVRGGYRLTGDVDLERFDSVAPRQDADTIDEERLRQVLALWRGDPFADAGSCAVLETEAQRLVERRASLIETYYRAVVDDCRYGEAIAELTLRCGDHPLRESMWELLIDAHYRAGHQAEALAHIARLRTNLRDDLGIGLSEALERLERKILEQRSEIDAGASRRQPGHAAPRLRGNLRVPTTSLVGRSDELREAESLLASGERVLTFVGPGGMGKTRLALELADLLLQRPDARPSWIVDLSMIDRPGCVLREVVATLGLARIGMGDPTDVLCDALELTPALLVLDTCETVVDEVSELAELIAGRCPRTTVIATSRQSLASGVGVAREVGPLPRENAISLFAARAHATRSPLRIDSANLDDIGRICARVDNSPLAIELLAARTPTFDLHKMIVRLDDIERLAIDTHGGHPSRHESLVTSVDFSYQMLDDRERLLFDRLSVFVGGFTLEAAEGVCDDGTIGADVIGELLEQLVDKSLVTVQDDNRTGRRYGLLDATRNYSARRLADRGGTDGLRSRHSSFFAGWISDAASAVWTEAACRWRRQTNLELGNVRQATAWACAHQQVDDALALARITGILTWNGRYDAVDWLLEVLDVPGVDEHPHVLPLISELAFHVWFGPGDARLARELIDRGLTIGDWWGLRFTLATLERALARATAPRNEELWNSALENARRATRLDANSTAGRSNARGMLLYFLAAEGERDEFYREWREHEATMLTLSGPLRALAANQCGALAVFEPERARSMISEALPASVEYGMPSLTTRLRSHIAAIDARIGEPRQAARSLIEVIDDEIEAGAWAVALGWMHRLVPILVRLGRAEDAVVLHHAIPAGALVWAGDEPEEILPELEAQLGAARVEGLAQRGARMDQVTLVAWLHEILESIADDRSTHTTSARSLTLRRDDANMQIELVPTSEPAAPPQSADSTDPGAAASATSR